MGIKGLWTVLTPYSEKKSLHEIQGQTLAVDLAGWVCDSQNVTDYYIQPKLYLRNLFFRTAYLILADISPIFVLEGDAPELKRDVMAERNAIQFRGARPKSDKVVNKQPSVTRKRFKGVLKECETLLKSMGVRCIKGKGEAEATCARLNEQGLVDAVVSQDSDCFAYGARRVYRNFSVSNSAGGGAMQGSVDSYDADKMFRDNGFGRKKMVALAILCGCDYGVGACGTAINTALSFLHTVSDDQIINRLLNWVSDTEHYEEQTRWVSAPGRCDRCGHVGRTHAKKGCPVCATHHGCEDKGHKAKVSEVKRELSLRNRALSSGMPFPEPKVMKEFLDGTTEDIDLNALKIPVPSLIQFVKIMTNKLDWSERYCVEKFLPLLTKWHLQDRVPCRTIKPIAIKKKRNPRGIPSYEVVWGDIDGQYEALIPDDQFDEEDDPKAPWTTTERQDLMRRFHPDLTESYEESIKKPPKVKKTRGKKKKDEKDNQNEENKEVAKPKRKYTKKAKTIKDPVLQTLNDSMKNLSLSSKAHQLNSSKTLNVSVSVNRLKRKLKHPKTKPKNTIEGYLERKKIKLSKSVLSLNKSLKNLSIVNSNCDDFCFENNNFDVIFDNNKENINSNNLLHAFNGSIECSRESDLSDILDQIISKAPLAKTAKVDNNLVKLIFNKNVTGKKINDSNIARYSPVSGSSVPLRKSLNHKKISIRKSVLEHNCSTPNSSPMNLNKISIRESILKNNCSTPNSSLMRKNFVHDCADNLFDSLLKNNTSHFFDKLTEDQDAFEMSVENLQGNSIIILDCNALK